MIIVGVSQPFLLRGDESAALLLLYETWRCKTELGLCNIQPLSGIVRLGNSIGCRLACRIFAIGGVRGSSYPGAMSDP